MKKDEVRIISDGTSAGTCVFDSTGEMIGRVQKIKWEISVSSGVSKATLEIAKVPIDGIAKKKRAPRRNIKERG